VVCLLLLPLSLLPLLLLLPPGACQGSRPGPAAVNIPSSHVLHWALWQLPCCALLLLLPQRLHPLVSCWACLLPHLLLALTACAVLLQGCV
jgi:hypothetical protein